MKRIMQLADKSCACVEGRELHNIKVLHTSLLSGFPGSAGILCSTSRVSTAITPTLIPPSFALPVTTLLPQPPERVKLSYAAMSEWE